MRQLKSEGYSGAEIVALCQEAALLAMEENIDVTEVLLQISNLPPFIDCGLMIQIEM